MRGSLVYSGLLGFSAPTPDAFCFEFPLKVLPQHMLLSTMLACGGVCAHQRRKKLAGVVHPL